MKIVASFDPATATDMTFNSGAVNGAGRMVVYNESNCNLALSWGGFSTYCPAWVAMLYCIEVSNPAVNWEIDSVLASNAPPISKVIVESYANNETIVGTFPASLVRQTNIGNAGAVLSGATNIVNDGNLPGTQIIESTVIADIVSAVTLTNDAKMVLGDTNNPGSLTMFGPATIPQLFLARGSLSRISIFAGTGVVNNATHGLGVTPDFIMIMYSGHFGVTPGHPIYYYGQTNAIVNVVADTGYAWVAVAIAF